MALTCLSSHSYTVDITVYHNGFHGDLNETFYVGDVDEEAKKLVQTTYECLMQAIDSGRNSSFVVGCFFVLFFPILLMLAKPSPYFCHTLRSAMMVVGLRVNQISVWVNMSGYNAKNAVQKYQRCTLIHLGTAWPLHSLSTREL